MFHRHLPPPLTAAEHPVDRVVLVVLDGLRADAVPAFDLGSWRRLAAAGCGSLAGATVEPSVTAAAMASLLTGVGPAEHGLRSDRFHLPRPRLALAPLPAVLAAAGLPTTAFVRRLPAAWRPLGRTVARLLGVAVASFAGDDAAAILAAARGTLRGQGRGLVLLHWPDCDQAGHAHGWMSLPYARAARRLDDLLGELAALVAPGPRTLLIALADHGGGGASPRDHDSSHPSDTTVPMLLCGDGVVVGSLAAPTLLDVAPTAAWALGAAAPRCWSGRALYEAFTPVLRLAHG
jgi:arylsulfatase A-like enzyme